MKKQTGFTLTEMMVSLVVASLILFLLGSVSVLGDSSYKKLAKEAGIYQDIVYGFKLMQSRVHGSQHLAIQGASGSWFSSKLEVDNAAFGLYTNGNNHDFVFLKNRLDETQREVIFSVPSADTVSLSFSPIMSGTQTIGVQAHLTGERDKIPFDLATMIKERT